MTYDDPADSGQILAIIAIVYGVAILVSLLFLVAYYIVMALALSKFFRKVGVESWIAWIPVYSSWKCSRSAVSPAGSPCSRSFPVQISW